SFDTQKKERRPQEPHTQPYPILRDLSFKEHLPSPSLPPSSPSLSPSPSPSLSVMVSTTPSPASLPLHPTPSVPFYNPTSASKTVTPTPLIFFVDVNGCLVVSGRLTKGNGNLFYFGPKWRMHECFGMFFCVCSFAPSIFSSF